jgi:hypothetical protein
MDHVLKPLRERAAATLSNLVTASKTQATSWRMSPVCLLNAAASHVSATITKAVGIREASRVEQDKFSASLSPVPSTPAWSGFHPLCVQWRRSSHCIRRRLVVLVKFEEDGCV